MSLSVNPQHLSRLRLCQTIPKCLSSYMWLLLWMTLMGTVFSMFLLYHGHHFVHVLFLVPFFRVLFAARPPSCPQNAPWSLFCPCSFFRTIVTNFSVSFLQHDCYLVHKCTMVAILFMFYFSYRSHHFSRVLLAA